MQVPELRFRQIHLDFHTHGSIPGIGADFDPEAFADTLARAHVDSINLFARGHHGHIYYDTKKFPERRHPHLTCNLLPQQVEACHARDIRCPIYITVQADHYTASRHPEWRILRADGALEGTPPYEAGFWQRLCLNTPYVDFLEAFTRDVFETMPVDGLWFDIVNAGDCSCRYCLEGMKAAGLDPANEEQRRDYGLEVLFAFQRRMTAFVRTFDRNALVFYNAGHVGPRHRRMLDAYTHLELESLPSGGWGYQHFPLAMRYARTLPADALGMTGKFQTTWGDFHSFKNEPALAYECFTMLALNGKCCIGDQLHPRGVLCPHTYDLVGSVYGEVEKREPWCRSAKPLADIGVLTPEEFSGQGVHLGLPPSAFGALEMLQELHHQFDVIDTAARFGTYKVLILPDEIPVSAALAAKLKKYLAGGGKLIASYRSGLGEDGRGFALDEVGVKLVGDPLFDRDFLVPRGPVGKGLPPTGHVMYRGALQVRPLKGARTLCWTETPYFNRTWEHFCSHQHAPSSGQRGTPGVVRRGEVIYFAHPIFALYRTQSPLWCKTLLGNALNLLLPDPLLRTGGPSTLVATVNEQPAERRRLVHLLNYIPVRRNESFEVIEDVIPLHDLPVSLKTSRRVRSVSCVPELAELPFEQADGRVSFRLPELGGYQIVAVSW